MTTTVRPNTTYAGTGMSFSELNALEDDDRNAVLAEAIERLREQIAPLKEQQDEAEKWIKSYATDRGPNTTLVRAGEREIKIERNKKWTYDVEGLTQLLAYGVTEEEFADAVHQVWNVSQSKLNELKKRGGRIAEVIETNSMEEVVGMKLVIRASKQEVKRRRDDSPYVSKFVRAGDEPD
jgi:hypothetical protein